MSTEPLGRSLGSAGQRLFIIGLVIVWASMLVSTTASAIEADNCENVADYDCTYHIEEKEIQKVPSFFKFQSRISQAKLPVGDVVFNNVIVNVKRGSQRLCREEFNDVVVRDSVLNLEIGREMENCVLEDKIAENSDLTFQICIGNEENCLKPIALSSVPYAIKSSYSFQAEKAHRANEATQAHYAHRVTADRDLFLTNRIGVGFYDFHTPSLEKIDILHNAYSSAMSYPWEDGMYQGGYMQWVQRDLTVPSNFHITARFETATGEPMPLDFLVVHAKQTHMLGKLVVEGQADYDPDTHYEGVDVAPALTVNRGMEVNGRTYMDHNVTMGSTPGQGRTCVVNHDLYQYGDSNFEANNTYRNGTTTFETETTLVSYGAVTMGQGSEVHFMGNTSFDSPTLFNDELNITEAGALNVDAAAHSNFAGNVDVYGTATFHGTVNIDGTASGIIPANNSVGNAQMKNTDVFYLAEIVTDRITVRNTVIDEDGNIFLNEGNLTLNGPNSSLALNGSSSLFSAPRAEIASISSEEVFSDVVNTDSINANNLYVENTIDGTIELSLVSTSLLAGSSGVLFVTGATRHIEVDSHIELYLSEMGLQRCNDIRFITVDSYQDYNTARETVHVYQQTQSNTGATIPTGHLFTLCIDSEDDDVPDLLYITNDNDYDVNVNITILGRTDFPTFL